MLGQANALLMPIEWNEPFGIVMVEAMACGTPVIGFAQGSVKEVIDESITGYKVQTFEEMCRAVLNNQIERLLCRNKARLRFDISVIADQYLSV